MTADSTATLTRAEAIERLKRYELDIEYDWPTTIESPTGRYLKYEDVIKALENSSPDDSVETAKKGKVGRFYSLTPLARRIMSLVDEGKTVEEAVSIATAKEDEGKETPNISVPDSAKVLADLREWLDEEIERDSEIAKTEEGWEYWSGRWDALGLVSNHLEKLAEIDAEARSERDSAQEGKRDSKQAGSESR